MTLAAQIIADASSTGCFGNTDDFARNDIIHHPAGNEALAESVLVFAWEQDGLDEGGGDGSGGNFTNERGISIRQRGLLEISADIVVTEEAPNGAASIWIIDGERWVTKKVIGKDDGMQSVWVSRLDKKATRRTSTQ